MVGLTTDFIDERFFSIQCIFWHEICMVGHIIGYFSHRPAYFLVLYLIRSCIQFCIFGLYYAALIIASSINLVIFIFDVVSISISCTSF